MKYKYIFFDWGYTLINKFKNVDSEINSILVKYNLKWDDIFRKWKNYQILNSLGKVTEKEIYKDLSLILNISEEDLEKWSSYKLAYKGRDVIELGEKKLDSLNGELKQKVKVILDNIKRAIISDNESLLQKYDNELTDLLFNIV